MKYINFAYGTQNFFVNFVIFKLFPIEQFQFSSRRRSTINFTSDNFVCFFVYKLHENCVKNVSRDSHSSCGWANFEIQK